MPELPEVETVKQTLNTLIVGKNIDRVTVYLARIIQRPTDIQQFCNALCGRTIEYVERRGKFLCIRLNDLVLVSHLRMEGRYGVFHVDEPVEKHTHVMFHFDDGSELRYKDVRQFGTMHLFQPGEEWTMPPLHKLGIEPLCDEFSVEKFITLMRKRRSFIKSVLLNQHVVVGIGNIYVDEALFRAGVHPLRVADGLSEKEYSCLHQAIVTILQEAVKAGGSSIKSYVNGQGEMGMFQHQLKIYGRAGQPCMNCHTPIEKTIVGGRGTHYCPRCQSLL